MSLDVSLHIGDDCVFHSNITHNLNKMAVAAGIYQQIWRPEELGINKAGEIVAAVESGLSDMRSNPEKYMPLSAENGWGTYAQFIPWVSEYLEACKSNPEAIISVSR